MNIAFYTHYFTPEIGAPSARVFELSRRWIDHDHDVQVVTCFPNHPTGEMYPGYQGGRYLHESLEGISVHRHWTYLSANKGFVKKTLGHISYLPSALWNSNRRIARPDLTIGTSPTFFAAMAAYHTAKRHHVPFVMDVRDLWPAAMVELDVLTNRYIIGALEKLELGLYRRATRVVTVTSAFRDNLIERGVPEKKVAVIPNGADVEFWRPEERPQALAAELGLEGKFVALYIGAHGISQALTHVLKAAELLREVDEIRFVFVGEGAEKAQLVRQADEAKLTNVTFLDPVDKQGVRDFYALSDVSLAPLRDIPIFKTFIPSKIFEIMAMGRPLIAPLRGETAEILERSQAALVIEPENAERLAEAIRQLYNDREAVRAMGERGRQFVVDHYSRDALASRYEEVMQEAREEYGAAGR